MRKLIAILLTAALLGISMAASADRVSNVISCELKEGKTAEDAHALNAEWLKWARSVAGTDEITSSMATTAVGEFGGFSWVDSYPDLIAWAKVEEAEMEDDNPELSEAFDALQECESNRLWRVEATEAAK